MKTRREIFSIMLRKKPLSDDVDVDGLSAMTENLSGGDIALICRRAAVNALRRDMNNFVITRNDFDEALRGIKR